MCWSDVLVYSDLVSVVGHLIPFTFLFKKCVVHRWNIEENLNYTWASLGFYLSVVVLQSLVSNDGHVDALVCDCLIVRLTLIHSQMSQQTRVVSQFVVDLHWSQMMYWCILMWLFQPSNKLVVITKSRNKSVVSLSVCLTFIHHQSVGKCFLLQYYLPFVWNQYKVKVTARQRTKLIISPSSSRQHTEQLDVCPGFVILIKEAGGRAPARTKCLHTVCIKCYRSNENRLHSRLFVCSYTNSLTFFRFTCTCCFL